MISLCARYLRGAGVVWPYVRVVLAALGGKPGGAGGVRSAPGAEAGAEAVGCVRVGWRGNRGTGGAHAAVGMQPGGKGMPVHRQATAAALSSSYPLLLIASCVQTTTHAPFCRRFHARMGAHEPGQTRGCGSCAFVMRPWPPHHCPSLPGWLAAPQLRLTSMCGWIYSSSTSTQASSSRWVFGCRGLGFGGLQVWRGFPSSSTNHHLGEQQQAA